MEYVKEQLNSKVVMLELKVNCIMNGRYCGLCCIGTEMPLTKEDIRSISSLGFNPREFVTYGGGIPRLKNVNGHCFFLDYRTMKCKIYSHRPEGCRFYPLIYVVGVGVTLDPLCPRSRTISSREIIKIVPYFMNYLRRLERQYNVKIIVE